MKMKKIIYFIFLSTFSNLYPQVNFSNGETLIDITHFPNNISALSAADLNNDGYKEIIVSSTDYNHNKIMLYKNINGNLQYLQRQILIQNTNVNPNIYDIFCADINNDGLIDIIVSDAYGDTISWFKNLGNFNFDNEIIISTLVDNPKSIIAADTDNDGHIDILVGSGNDKNVSLFKNNGNGIFAAPEEIQNTSFRVSKMKLFDLDNNGYLDLISGHENGTLYWSKNVDGSNFSAPIQIPASADEGTGYDFLDVDGDSYYDIVFSSNYDDSLNYVLNMEGDSFSNEIVIDNLLLDPYNVMVKDFDDDGLDDIIVSTTTQDKIGWYKNNDNGSFSSLEQISNNVFNPKHFLIEDFDNNGYLDVICSSYDINQHTTGQKLSLFKKNITSNIFEETLINSFYSPAYGVKIADLDNDGNNDIISILNYIIWNKNYGNNTFSSQYLLYDDAQATDIEFADLNSDGWLDLILLADDKLEIRKNIGGIEFELVHSQTISSGSIGKIEISDLNNDGNLDIIISHNYGDVPLSKVINNEGFDFQNISPIYTFGDNGYKAYSFKCSDVNNDGFIDIIVGARDQSEIHWLENDGNGNFTYQLIASSISCDQIDAGDIDNDGFIDIIAASSYNSGAYDLNWLKKNSEDFLPPIKIDNQSLKSVTLGDINNDGFLDIVGTSYEYYSPYNERILYYLFNNNSFENQVTIESLGETLSLSKDLVLGDLNNDNKLDIVSSYYFINTIKYFWNLSSTTLSFESPNIKNEKELVIYPNPSSEFINWDKNLRISNISIYDYVGKLICVTDTRDSNKLNINFLSRGLYFIIAQSETSRYNAKLIIGH